MRQQAPDSQGAPQQPMKRPPGRSFEDPRKPMGEDLIENARESVETPEAGVYGREDVGAQHQGSVKSGVAERAKAIGVLRKAEELMDSNNPPPENLRRAI